MVEYLTGQFAETIIEHMKSICRNDRKALMHASKDLCSNLREAGGHNKEVVNCMNKLMLVIRGIEAKQVRQVMAVETQILQIKQR